MNPEHAESEPGCLASPNTARVVRALAITSGLGGAILAAGWVIDHGPARSLFLGSAPISLPMTGCLLLTAAALGLMVGEWPGAFRPRALRLCAVLVLGLSGAVAVDDLASGRVVREAMEWLSGPGVVQSPVPDPSRTGGALLDSGCFFFYGLAVLLGQASKLRHRHFAATVAAIGTVMALVGVMLQSIGLGGTPQAFAEITGPFPFGLLMLTTGIGMLLVHPAHGWLATWWGPQPGSRALRWMLPATTILPGLVAWIGLHGEQRGWFSREFAWTAVATLLPLGTALVIWTAARSINRLQHELEKRNLNHARFTALVASSSDAIIAKDLNGIITSWNPGAERIFGYSADEMAGQSILRLIPPDRHEEEDHILSRLRRGLQVDHFETIRLRKDGQPIWVSITVSPILDPSGGVIGASKVARDITGRKQFEERASWLATFPERNPIPIVEVDPATGRIHYANPSARRAFPTLEIEGRNHPLLANLEGIASQLHRDDAESFRREVSVGDRVLAQSLTYIREARRLRIYNTDVTEQRRALDELREKAVRMRLATEATGVGIWEWNLADNRVRWDAQMFRIYGVAPTPEWFVTYQTWRDAVHAEDIAEQEASLQKTIRRQDTGSREFRIRRVDDQDERIIQAIEVVLPGPDGAPAWVVGTNLDITDRRHAENEVKASRARFELLVEAAPSAIVLVNGQGRITLANANTEALFGYQREELLGNPVEMLIPARLRDAHPGQRTSFLQAPTSRPMGAGRDLHAVRKDGSEVPVEIGLSPIPTADGVAVLASIIDITARKQAETQRESLLGELAEKNAQMERFLYMVSHDLKSPLITIKAFASMVALDIQSGHPDQVSGDLARINGAADKMNSLLEELLRFSRVGRVVNPLEEVSVSTLAEEARELVQGRLLNRGVTVSIAPDLPPAQVDRPRMVEVFQNLIDNAAKFMGDQPNPRVEIGMVTGPGQPRFFVRDNGIGLDVGHQETLFGLFNKLDPKSEGSGVGLALVKRIVELHGGRIWIESEGRGKGSTFWMTLGRDPLVGPGNKDLLKAP